MRCVYCGKPLGRFRKATGEFCSEEHRDRYRDQIERAALERLLISREKLTSSQQHASVPSGIAELLQPALFPLKASGWDPEVRPIQALPAALFPSSAGLRQRSSLRTGRILQPQCRALHLASHLSGLVDAIVIPASLARASLPADGVRPNSAHLRSAHHQLPLRRTLPASCQSVRRGIKLEADPFVANLILPSGLASAGGQTLRLNARATLITLRTRLLRPIPPGSAAFGERNFQPVPASAPWIGASGITLPGAGLEGGQRMAMTVAMRRNCIATGLADPIRTPCDSPRLPRSLHRVRAAFHLSVAPKVPIFPAAPQAAGRAPGYSPEVPLSTAGMVLLPGTRNTKCTEIESGIPDRLDALRALAMPAPFRHNHRIEEALPPVFRPAATLRLPEARVETGTAGLAVYDSPLRLGPPRPLPLLAESSSSNAATLPSHVPTVFPRALAKPLACLPEAVRLIKLICPPDACACAAETLKKTSNPTDGFYAAARADRLYPRLGFTLQPVWNAPRVRLVRFHAGVVPRNRTAGVRGSAEPEDASAWLPSLRPRARLVPAVWQFEECESIEAPIEVSTHRRLTRIAPVLRWWRNSNRTLKGSVIAFVCMLAFGFYSSISNPQPVSATTENAASAAVTGPLRVLQQSVANRAGVHLSDDFRTGLHAWEGGEDWSDSWSYDEAGFVHPGRLALYTPSLKMADYRMEFVGQISKKGLAWVVRAADVKNYVAVKLVQISTGPRARLAVVRYAIVNGKEERHKQIAFPFEARTDTVYQVRMEVGGNRYSLYIQDRMADTWEDDRFTSGGVGFFSAKGEDARLRWVRITYQYDWVGRICAALAG